MKESGGLIKPSIPRWVPICKELKKEKTLPGGYLKGEGSASIIFSV
jgi:hypothetical protein